MNKLLLHEKRNEIQQIAARYGARNIRVFGSVARDEATDASDVDFLAEMEPGRSLFDLGGLYADLHDLLQCPVDVVTENSVSEYIRNRVLSEAVPV